MTPPLLLYAVTASVSHKLLAGQAEFMREQGFETGIISSPGSEAETSAQRGVAVYPIEMEREISPLKDLRALWQLYRLLRRLKPAVTNVSTPKAGLLGGLAAWFAGVPCRIFTLRGLRSETARGLKGWIVRSAEKISCRCAHRVVCVSPSLAAKAIELRLTSPAKIRVLHSSNGVNADRFQPASAAQRASKRRELGIPEGVPVIGFAGRFTRDKGIVELVEACDRLRQEGTDLRLLLLGDFEPGDAPPDEIRARIVNSPWILRPGFTDPISYFGIMDVVVLPTYREGFPNVVLEAQSMEIPVVTTRAVGACDSIADGETGFLVEVRDVSATREAVLKLLRDSELRLRFGKAARKRILEKFKNEIVWQEICRIHRELMAERGIKAPVAAQSNAAECTR